MIIDNESLWAIIGTIIGLAMGIYIGWNLKIYDYIKQKKEREK